jgi:CheY-like chemotaxis protein
MTINALRDTLPPEHLQNLVKAEQAARTLMQLISDILDFSKIEAEQMETYIEEFPLEDLIEEILVTTEGLIDDKMLVLNSEIDPDLPFVESDYIKMKQILNNLVSNAVKFTTEGGVIIRAKTISRPEPDGGVCVEVEDTGCGIHEDQLATIFTSFKQIDGSIKKRFGGTGLGLAITKKLCDSLGIEIGIRSEKGKGTTFWLNVPVKYHLNGFRSKGATNAQYPASGIQEPREEIEEEFFPELSSNAVLACFSPQETCEMIEQYFGGLPLELQHVSTVAECVELGKSRLVWVILVEPDGEGFEALTQLKHEPAFSHIPVIFCSIEAQESGFYQSGPVEHLTKPIDRGQLLKVLLRIAKQQGDILVVDDDPNLRALYGQILSRAGYIPHVVENGLKALDFLRDHPLPQAMILDLLMPEMDGFQVLDYVQANETWRRIPIVVVTGKTSSPEERKRIDKGAQLLLHKGSFPIEELPKQIESVVHTVALTGTQSILVVDDNQMNLDLMAGVFQKAGYTVYTANSGQEGVDIAKAVVPDVIVMDLAMPEMDGFEATQQIKQHPPTADITVIACSAFATKDYQKRAFQAGCEGYITKPVEPEHLIEQITKLILTSKIRRRMRKYGTDISDR